MRLTKMITGLIVVLAVVPCFGEEIIIFKSGQTMAVVSHSIQDGMVHVDLGGNAFIAFPEATIDSIEVAGKNVMIKASYSLGANRRVPTTAGSYPAVPILHKPDYEFLMPEPGDDTESNVEIDKATGMAVYRPMANSKGANKRRFAATGDMRALGNNYIKRGNGDTTFGGTTPLGTNHVIGGLDPRRSDNARQPKASQAVSVQLKPGIANGSRTDSPRDDQGKRPN